MVHILLNYGSVSPRLGWMKALKSWHVFGAGRDLVVLSLKEHGIVFRDIGIGICSSDRWGRILNEI